MSGGLRACVYYNRYRQETCTVSSNNSQQNLPFAFCPDKKNLTSSIKNAETFAGVIIKT